MAVQESGSRWRAGRDFRVAAAPSDRPDHYSRHTNQNNSVNGAEGRSQQFADDRELPTPGEVASEFFARYPELAKLPLTRQDGRKLRSELMDRPTDRSRQPSLSDQLEDSNATISKTNQPDDWLKGFEVTEELGRNPWTWGRALVALLQDHEENRNTWLHLERGYPDDPGHATFDTKMESRFMASYQKKYFAQMKGWFRETVGVGERPSGATPEGSMDDPVVALFTRSASSVPDGARLSPVDHFDQLRESWSVVYDALRNRMDELDLESEDWHYDRRLEPHDGGGINSCYPHEHVVLVVDHPELTPADLRSVVETHVEQCDAAGPEAHDLDVGDWDANRTDVETVEVRDPEEIDDLAAYVCDYASIEPDDLLEREVEYVAFATAAWATATRTITRSDRAVHASTADRCKQRFESDACDQELDHGEEIRRVEIRGSRTLVCECCESPHGIDQSQTLVEARSPDSGPTAVADGGRDFESELEEDLRERWPHARSAAKVGESPARSRDRDRIRRQLRTADEHEPPDQIVAKCWRQCELPPEELVELVQEERADFDRAESVASFERPPKWRLEAISIDGERHAVNSSGGGVDLETTKLQGDALTEWILRNTALEDVDGMFKIGRVTVSGVRSVAHWVGERAGADRRRASAVLEGKVMLLSHNGESVPRCLFSNSAFPRGPPSHWSADSK